MTAALRQTRQRRAVWEALQRQGGHPTVRELHEAVKRELPRISLGTVYRNLELLVAQGLAVKLPAQGGRARFDGDCSPHAHVRCVRCGRIEDVDGTRIGFSLEKVHRVAGFKVLAACVELRGICPACRTEAAAPGSGIGRRRPALYSRAAGHRAD